MCNFKIIFKEILQFACLQKYIIYHGKRENKNIALTFDDGPNPKYTPRILRILAEYEAKATFFTIGENAEKHPDLVEQMIHAGHSIGNHTYNHNACSLKTWASLKQEIIAFLRPKKNNRFLFRPPHGKFSFLLLLLAIRKRFSIILWSIDSMDWLKGGKEEILGNVNSLRTKGGDIILLHDDLESTCEALPLILENLKHSNYQFVTVPEMLKLKDC